MATKPGERRLQILQTLAAMLENPRAEKVTTAALAAKLDVSEAALYRHFASKAQMYEGLIEFIETTLFTLVNKIVGETTNGAAQAQQIVNVLLGFAEKNPGMTRVLIGDALVNEDERLQARMNQLYDRIEAALRQALRIAQAAGEWPGDPGAEANVLVAYVLGRWQLFAKSGFKRGPAGWLGGAAQVPLRLKHGVAKLRRAPYAALSRGLHVDGARTQPGDLPASVRLLFHRVQRDPHGVVGADETQRLNHSSLDDRAFEKLGVAGRDQRAVRGAHHEEEIGRGVELLPDAGRGIGEGLAAVAGLQRRELLGDDGLDRLPVGVGQARFAASARRRRGAP